MFQPVYPDFESMNLLWKEKIVLFTLRFKKCRNGEVFSQKLNKLREYGLISQNYLPQRGREGESLSDGTYSLSDRGKRYIVYLRKQRFHRYLNSNYCRISNKCSNKLVKRAVAAGTIKLATGSALMAGHTIFLIAHISPIPINDSIPITIVNFTLSPPKLVLYALDCCVKLFLLMIYNHLLF